MKPFVIYDRSQVRYVPSPLELRRHVNREAWRGLLYAGILVAIAAVTAYCWWTA